MTGSTTAPGRSALRRFLDSEAAGGVLALLGKRAPMAGSASR